MFMRNNKMVGVLVAAGLALAMPWQAAASDSQIVAGQIKSADTELSGQIELSETEILEDFPIGKKKAVMVEEGARIQKRCIFRFQWWSTRIRMKR